MIVTEIGHSRKLVGALEINTDLTAGLTELCHRFSVSCGHIRAVGYVRDPVFRRYSRGQAAYLPDETFEGVYQLASCEGFISLGEQDELDIFLHAAATASEVGRNKVILGQLVRAQVIQFELVLETFENVSLRRLLDASTGLRVWLQAMPSGGAEEGDLQAGGREPEFTAVDAQEVEPDDISLERGDWLDHPRLGKCLVLAPDNDERVPVKLPSGRVAELHLGLFRLFRLGKKEGGTLYRVEVRRKK
jgi:predicted DNA-binding protein with PD1-like motif